MVGLFNMNTCDSVSKKQPLIYSPSDSISICTHLRTANKMNVIGGYFCHLPFFEQTHIIVQM